MTPEQDSIKGYEKLKTAKDYGYENMPCDICKKVTGKTRFWGGTSVLVCGGSECNSVVSDEWKESFEQNKRDYEDECNSSGHWEDDWLS